MNLADRISHWSVFQKLLSISCWTYPAPRNGDTPVQVKHDDVTSKVFGWADFFVFVLLTFALGFATNAKMYALPLDRLGVGSRGIAKHQGWHIDDSRSWTWGCWWHICCRGICCQSNCRGLEWLRMVTSQNVSYRIGKPNGAMEPMLHLVWPFRCLCLWTLNQFEICCMLI